MKLSLLFVMSISSAFGTVIDDSTLPPDKRGIGPLGVQYSKPSAMSEKFKLDHYKNIGIVHNEKGNYKVFTSVIGDVSVYKTGEAKELFFGEQSSYKDFFKKEVENEYTKKTAGSASEILLNGMTTAGKVVAVTLFDPWGIVMDKTKENYFFYRVTHVINKQGKSCKLISMFVSDNNKFSLDEIRIIIAEQEKRYLQ